MEWASEEHPAEWAVDVAAAALFAAAAAFAASALASGSGLAAALGALAFLPAYAVLRRVEAEQPVHALLAFEPTPFEANRRIGSDRELLLTPDQRVDRPDAGDELVLDDALIGAEPDSRVVRLFDPSRVHPVRSPVLPSVSVPSDASQALSDALAELRRSLH